MPEEIQVGALGLRFLHSKHDTAGGLDMFEMTCPTEGRMPAPHYHRDWEETIYGLSGTLTWTVVGEAVDVGPGDTLFIRRGVVHGFSNRGAVPARCLCVLTPGVLGPEYFREMAAALASGPPSLEVLQVAMLKLVRRILLEAPGLCLDDRAQ